MAIGTGKAVLLLILFATALSTRGHFASAEPALTNPGGRFGSHGMVVYGAGPYYIDHIPMLMAPHDVQLIAEVKLTHYHGAPVTDDFSSGTFTIDPSSAFSLDDLITGALPQFQGTVHRGSFEHDGPIIQELAPVHVQIVKILLARKLPATAVSERLIVGVAPHEFSVNLITAERNQQLIQNVSTGKMLWCVKAPDFSDPCD